MLLNECSVLLKATSSFSELFLSAPHSAVPEWNRNKLLKCQKAMPMPDGKKVFNSLEIVQDVTTSTYEMYEGSHVSSWRSLITESVTFQEFKVYFSDAKITALCGAIALTLLNYYKHKAEKEISPW